MIKYVVVEHLEPCISPWMLSEYEFLVEVLNDVATVVFTNVRRKGDVDLLKSRVCSSNCLVKQESITSLVREGVFSKVIVLDPQAPRELTLNDLRTYEVVVIGGIMGDYPPRGRTKELITSRLSYKAVPRNLGREQLTIAGTAYVLKRMLLGDELSSIKMVKGVKFRVELLGSELEIELPYVFPLDENGEVIIPSNYEDVVVRSTQYFEGLGGCRDDEASG